MEVGWIVPWMGNTYSGSSPTGLAAILDVASPGDLIFMFHLVQVLAVTDLFIE